MLASAFRMSLMPLLLALALALIGVLLFGSMVYYAERGQYSTGNKEWVMREGDRCGDGIVAALCT